MYGEHTFQQTQHDFCDWLRDPNSAESVPFALDRMQVWRELLFNNVCSFINLVYPVAQSLLSGEQQWQQLLTDFFRESQNQSPFYNDISLQFKFLAEQQHPIFS